LHRAQYGENLRTACEDAPVLRKGSPVSEGSSVEAYEAAGYVEFLVAGQPAVGEYHCSECGYGVAVQRELPMCPMCRGSVWERSTFRTITHGRPRQ
jgi:rubrerythrin